MNRKMAMLNNKKYANKYLKFAKIAYKTLKGVKGPRYLNKFSKHTYTSISI